MQVFPTIVEKESRAKNWTAEIMVKSTIIAMQSLLIMSLVCVGLVVYDYYDVLH